MEHRLLTSPAKTKAWLLLATDPYLLILSLCSRKDFQHCTEWNGEFAHTWPFTQMMLTKVLTHTTFIMLTYVLSHLNNIIVKSTVWSEAFPTPRQSYNFFSWIHLCYLEHFWYIYIEPLLHIYVGAPLSWVNLLMCSWILFTNMLLIFHCEY